MREHSGQSYRDDVCDLVDATGDTLLCEGDVVVYADGARRLHKTRVKAIELTRAGHVRVRLHGATWTTPDRVAVVESG